MRTEAGERLAGYAAAVAPIDETARRAAEKKWDAVAKPLGSMGIFEEALARIAGMTGETEIRLDPARVLVFCADNGVTAEGVSQSDASVTAAVAENIARGRGNINRLAAAAGGVEVHAVDIGMAGQRKSATAEEAIVPIDTGGTPARGESGASRIVCASVRRGTRNFLREPAMTEEEAIAAIDTGVTLAREAKAQGMRICLTGEMGIGNTTTSSAVAAVLLGRKPRAVTGRGAGLSDEGFARKLAVIEAGIARYGFGAGEADGAECAGGADAGRSASALREETFRLLRTLGGFDIAGLAGLCLGGALCRMPVLLDGVIALTAALAAEHMFPGVREYLLAGHEGKEPACRLLLRALGLDAPICAHLALGEGSGAVMALALYRQALAVYRGDTFDRIGVAPYVRYV